jgi:hypothetical protein
MPTGADVLHIRRHQFRYRVTKGTAATLPRSTVQMALQTALAGRAPAVVRPGDGSVWLIRRLEIGATVGASWTSGSVANAVANAVVAALARTFDRGADGLNVKRFPDRAAFTARLLIDCADDRAAGRWEYAGIADEISGLGAGAIRSIIAAEPGTALDALVQMTPADLRRVLRRLGSSDAEMVLDSLASTGASTGDPVAHVVEALDRLLARAEFPGGRAPATLALFVEVARANRRPPPAGTTGRAKEIAQLAATLRAATPREARRLVEALDEGDWRAVAPGAMEELTGFVSWPPEARAKAVRSLVRAQSGGPEEAPRAAASRLPTELGGMFLLLPLIEEVPWKAATTMWPRLEEIEASRLLQYLTVIAALGVERNAVAAGDRVLRLALGIPDAVDARSVSAWSRQIEANAIRRSIDVRVKQLRQLQKVSGDVTLAALRGGVVAVDGALGIWLGSVPAAPASIRELVASIDAALGTPARITASAPWIEACLESGRVQSRPIDKHLMTRLDEQARYATIGAPFELPETVSNMVMLAAHALCRALAWRLPGFSSSTLGYLSDNFLSFAAEVSFEPEQIVVYVGDPPLHLVLTLAGMNRRRFRLDATGDREWILTQQR